MTRTLSFCVVTFVEQRVERRQARAFLFDAIVSLVCSSHSPQECSPENLRANFSPNVVAPHMVRTTRNSAFPLIMRAYPSAAFPSGYFRSLGGRLSFPQSVAYPPHRLGSQPTSPGFVSCRRPIEWEALRSDLSARPRRAVCRSPLGRPHQCRHRFPAGRGRKNHACTAKFRISAAASVAALSIYTSAPSFFASVALSGPRPTADDSIATLLRELHAQMAKSADPLNGDKVARTAPL